MPLVHLLHKCSEWPLPALPANDTLVNRPLPKHPLYHLGLPFVKLVSMPVIETCLGNEEAYAIQSDLLRCKHQFRKSGKPRCDVQCLLVPLKLITIVFSLSFDGEGERK